MKTTHYLLTGLLCITLLTVFTYPSIATADDTASETFTVTNGAFPWSDRVNTWQLADVPDSINGNGPYPQGTCGSRNVVVPDGTTSVLIGISNKDVDAFKSLQPTAAVTGESISVVHPDGTGKIPYTIFKLASPPPTIQGTGFVAGTILLQIGDKAGAWTPAPPSTNAASITPPAKPEPFKPNFEPFDPGDKAKLHIFLLMGQSNMVGRDTTGLETQTTDPRIGFLRSKNWFIAIEPMHQGGSGFGPGISFAQEILKKYPDGKVALVPCAVGGTPLSRWVKGADLYANALKEAKIAADSGVIEGMLWHQGESNSNKPEEAATYESQLTQMFTDFRTDLGLPNLPIVVGQLGPFVKLPSIDTVKAALAQMPQQLPYVGFADSNDLTDKGDHLHFNAASQHLFGQRYAAAMDKLLQPAPAPTPAPTPAP